MMMRALAFAAMMTMAATIACADAFSPEAMSRPFLGVAAEPDPGQRGMRVLAVAPGSPADDAGIQVGGELPEGARAAGRFRVRHNL